MRKATQVIANIMRAMKAAATIIARITIIITRKRMENIEIAHKTIPTKRRPPIVTTIVTAIATTTTPAVVITAIVEDRKIRNDQTIKWKITWIAIEMKQMRRMTIMQNSTHTNRL